MITKVFFVMSGYGEVKYITFDEPPKADAYYSFTYEVNLEKLFSFLKENGIITEV